MRAFYRKLIIASTGISALIFVPPAMAKKGNKNTPTPTPTPSPTPTPTTSDQITADLSEVSNDQTALNTARKAVDDATAKLVADYEATPGFVAVQKAADDAVSALQAARTSVLNALNDDSTFKAKSDQEAVAQAALDKLRASGAAKDAISAKAGEEFDLDGTVSKMQRGALESDAAYKAAAEKSDAASAAVALLRSRFKDFLKTDPRLATVHQARDDAQAKLAAAQAKLVTDRDY